MFHILLIDEDAQFRLVIARVLRLDGYDVSEAEDGAAGVACWRERPADLVITDLRMPRAEDGLETMLQLRALAPAVPIMVISGDRVPEDPELLRDAQLLGTITLLQKPFRLGALTAAVRSALIQLDQRQA
jgi:CheY-like chemotaxis protein